MAASSTRSSTLIKKSSYLDISHLDVVIDVLRLIPKKKWQLLGLKLGLLQPTLDTIETNHKQDVERCLKECLSKWLTRVDKVDEYGHPTLSRLADALEEIDDKTTAKIRNQSYTEAATKFPEDLKDAYLSMNAIFAQLLVDVVTLLLKETPVKQVKLFLSAFESGASNELKAVDDHYDLIAYLRKHSRLSNYGLLEALIKNERFNLKQFEKDLEAFKKKRQEFYQMMLAKDFAKLAGKDNEIADDQRKLVFKVSWSLRTTTLKELEEFINDSFPPEHQLCIILVSVHH